MLNLRQNFFVILVLVSDSLFFTSAQSAAQVASSGDIANAFWLRTAPILVFDLQNGNYVVPFGFGIGQVMKVDKTVFNIFIEPQFTILHDGFGQPAFQIFTGLNLRFQ